MPNRDVRLELDPKVSLAPQSIGGAVLGTGVDLQGCDAALVIVDNGAATAAATIKVQESADNVTFTDVADSDLTGGFVGNPAGLAQVASTIVKIGYVGVQRYIRVSTTAGTAALLSAEVVRAHLRHAGGVPV